MNLLLPQYSIARESTRGRPPKVVEDINKLKLEPFMNMSFIGNKVTKIYPGLSEFYGMEEVIEQVVANFARAARRPVLGATQFAQYRCLQQGLRRLLFW